MFATLLQNLTCISSIKEKKVWQKAKLSLINVSFGNTSECVIGIHLVWLIKICQFFCDLPFAGLIPKICIAADIVGLGFFALIKSLDFDISIIYN